MKAILRQNKTDSEMIEVITISTVTGKELMWGVVHCDFIEKEDIQLDFEVENSLEIEIKTFHPK